MHCAAVAKFDPDQPVRAFKPAQQAIGQGLAGFSLIGCVPSGTGIDMTINWSIPVHKRTPNFRYSCFCDIHFGNINLVTCIQLQARE
jgi:hypothetical protein